MSAAEPYQMPTTGSSPAGKVFIRCEKGEGEEMTYLGKTSDNSCFWTSRRVRACGLRDVGVDEGLASGRGWGLDLGEDK